MQLKSISKNRPEGMIIDVAEEDAKALIKTGEFIELTKENLIIKKKEEKVDKIIEEIDEKLTK